MHRGRLNLAANEYTCLYLLPLLDEFRRQNPRIKLAVQRTLASRISDEVLMHSVELGVLSFRPDDAQVKSMVVYRDELAFVVNPRHPLAGAGKVSIRQLGAQNFIAHNIPSPQRQKVIQTFKRHKTPLQMGVELPSLEAIKRFVEMGNGVALVPGLTVRPELESGALVRVHVPELQIERKLRLVYRRQASLSHAALAFLKVVEAYAAAHGDPYCFQAGTGNVTEAGEISETSRTFARKERLYQVDCPPERLSGECSNESENPMTTIISQSSIASGSSGAMYGGAECTSRDGAGPRAAAAAAGSGRPTEWRAPVRGKGRSTRLNF